MSREKTKTITAPTTPPVPTDEQLRERFLAKCLPLGEYFDEFLKIVVQPVLKGILIGGGIYELEAEFLGKDKLFHYAKDFNEELEKHSRIGQSTRYMFTGLKDREPAILERMKVDPFLGVDKALELPSSKPTGEGTGSRGKDKTKRKTSGKGGKGNGGEQPPQSTGEPMPPAGGERRTKGRGSEVVGTQKVDCPVCHTKGVEGLIQRMDSGGEYWWCPNCGQPVLHKAPPQPTGEPTAQPSQPTVTEVTPEAGEQPQVGEPTVSPSVVVSESFPSQGNGTAAEEGRPVPPSLEGLVKLVENYFTELGSRFQIVKAKAGDKVEAVEGTFLLIMPVEEGE